MMKEQITTIDISKEDLKFSCAHFTIFSSTKEKDCTDIISR